MNTILFRLFYDLSVYNTVIHQTTIRNFLRFLSVYLVLGFGYAVYFGSHQLPSILDQSTTVVKALTQAIPDQATLSIQDYQLSTTNLNLPFEIPSILYLDPRADAVALSSTSASLALGSTHFRIKNQDSYQLFSYQEQEITNLHLTGSEFNRQLDELTSIIDPNKPYLPLAIFISTYLVLVSTRILSIFFYSLIFRLLNRLYSSQYRLGEIFRLYLNASLPIETISLIVLMLYGPGYTMVYSIGLVGLSILAFLHLPARIPHTSP